MSKIGKPNKLTPQLQEQIVDLLRRGNFIQTVCAYVGISKSSYFSWIRLGSKASQGIHYDFVKAVDKAHAEAEMRMLQDITNSNDWVASAWKLERRFPKRYSYGDYIPNKAQ